MVRQTVELLVFTLPVRPARPHVFGGSLRRSDRLDGPDASGAAPRDHLRELPVHCSWSGSMRRDRPVRRSVPIAASAGWTSAPSIECGGDRVLVQKFLYDFRRPEALGGGRVSFSRRAHARPMSSALWACPGNRSGSRAGDIFVDGKIVRKSLPEIRAMRMLVHDSRFPASGCQTFSALAVSIRTRAIPTAASGWSRKTGQFAHSQPRRDARPRADWLVYRHWDPAHGRYGPVRDFYGYNGGDLGADNEVADLGIEARLCVSEAVDVISVALRSGSDQFVVRIPVGRRGSIELLRNNQRQPLSNCCNPFEEMGLWPTIVTLEAAVVDRRVQVAIDGRLLFDPFDYDDPLTAGSASESPVALGVRGGAVEVDDLRIYRDIYYTSSLANTPRHSHGMVDGRQVGSDEYFVLGDNSPVSNDSRFWNEGPVVRGLDVRREAVSGASARPGGPAQGLRPVGLLGSRSATNPLHSVDWVESRRARSATESRSSGRRNEGRWSRLEASLRVRSVSSRRGNI